MRKIQQIVVVLVALTLIGVALYFGMDRSEGTIRVGGKNFTEQTIVGEMAALLIEYHAGLEVDRKFFLASNLPTKMIQSGDLDVFLDYTGTGFCDILGREYQQQSREEILETVQEEYPKQFDAMWLEPVGFKNTYTLTMRRDHAERLGIVTISDLEPYKNQLDASFDPAFLDREDGYAGLVKHYGFEFAEEPGQLAVGLMYKACAEGQTDVIDAFSTDGRIGKFDLKILEDDKRFFPPYDAAFVVRGEVVRKYPKVAEALNLLAGRIDEATMQRLNLAVDDGGRPERVVAEEFLRSEGLLD